MNINTSTNHAINFQAKFLGYEYSDIYLKNTHHNGKKPDDFILSRLAISPQQKTVFDMGAGQGRNAVPIAEQGHTVYAFEINPMGVREIREQALDKNVYDNIKIFRNNILERINVAKKADFAFMSHITQHFNNEELQQVFFTAHEALKRGGEFVFDALIRTNHKYKKYDVASPFFTKKRGVDFLEEYGAVSFKKEDIISAGEKAGFKFILEVPFQEASLGRAKYEHKNLWGGFCLLDYLKGLGRKPVKLNWFVFRK